MIKLRAEWHRSCQNCGTELVADCLDDVGECQVCPWCGHIEKTQSCPCDGDVREYLQRSIREIEDRVNLKVTQTR